MDLKGAVMENPGTEIDQRTSIPFGMYYFPDTLHYGEKDLQTWLPEFSAMGITSLILQADLQRAVPESFIHGLISAGIEPVIQYHLPLSNPPRPEDLQNIWEAYAHWGVKKVLFFDKPNDRSVWTASAWTQQDLIERFLDRYIPLANLALVKGLTPLFPPLQPGGSYWDTAFLRAVLSGLQRREENDLLDNLILTAYGWENGCGLNWGVGGPERWPESRPYFTPQNSQDQRGFRSADWYLAIAQAVLQKTPQIIILQAGASPDNSIENEETHCQLHLAITRLASRETVREPGNDQINVEPLNTSVQGIYFWLLASSNTDAQSNSAWFKQDGSVLPIVTSLKEKGPTIPEIEEEPVFQDHHPSTAFLLQHYLLLPSYEWGVADWHLDVVRGFIKKNQPTVGFSLAEASLASRVTVIGGPDLFAEDDLETLRINGSFVERIEGDGTSIATQLAER
jgi:hypothetical protein